jgi:membrane-bound lytic murein transglycosylase B
VGLVLGLLCAPISALTETLPWDQRIPPTSALKGWDYLVDQVVKFGVERSIVERYYSDTAMPERGFIPFAASPKESPDLYKDMVKPERIAQAQACYTTNLPTLTRISKKAGVPARVIASIMYVETGCGRNLGTQLVLLRLSRLAGLAAPDNVQWNFERLSSLGEEVTVQQIAARADYLRDTFLEQIPALLSLSARANVSPFSFKGSSAGAFGIPQFLPLSLIRYGTDGNGDHHIDLESIPDAAASIGTYLAMNGWKGKLTRKEKMAVLFTYNRSEPYGATVLKIADKLQPR